MYSVNNCFDEVKLINNFTNYSNGVSEPSLNKKGTYAPSGLGP